MAQQVQNMTRSHIGFSREPDIDQPRRKQQWHGPTIPSRDRRAHGEAIDTKVLAAATAVKSVRDSLGVAPDRLLVLTFTSVDPECRTVLERFGATIVDEQVKTGEHKEFVHITVQLSSDEAVHQLRAEAEQYCNAADGQSRLPVGMRSKFFNCLESVDNVSRADRTGPRLDAEGLPATEPVQLDVDFWHPGRTEEVLTLLKDMRALCHTMGGRLVDEIRTGSLILARVSASHRLAEAFLDLDLVAQVDLPPRLPRAYGSLFDPVPSLPERTRPKGDEPRVAVIDSGVHPGHPLLRGWVVDSMDFDSGEDTPVDRSGHGTQVAGLVAYGDIAECLETGVWQPKVAVANAKVLRCHPFYENETEFPAGHRPEAVVARAIKHFHDERGCRVFNLSIGNRKEVYNGGRQFPWAEVLDNLARELDIVVVVSAGNDPSPDIPPDAPTRSAFQREVQNRLLSNPAARICSPGTAAIAVTVGSVARSDAPLTAQSFAGAAAESLSPFSRVGPGYEVKPAQRAIKPEFVAYGGNFAVRRGFGDDEAGWVRTDLHLGEPTTGLDSGDGRFVTARNGTSFATPQVSNAAGLALKAATAALGRAHANAARALLGVSARTPSSWVEWLGEDGRESWNTRRQVGYGLVDTGRARASTGNDACLIGEDTVEEDRWHVYSVPVPNAFLNGRGARGISVALAFDPPVRASRKEYLARTMWIEAFKGLAAHEIAKYRAPHQGEGKAPKLSSAKVLEMRPARTQLFWSTLQVRRRVWVRAPVLPKGDGGERSALHLVVGCQRRFEHGEGSEQRYSVAVRLWHSDAGIDLHQEIQSSIRRRVVVRPETEVVVS